MLSLTIFSLIVLFLSIIIHEIAHGSVALLQGDTTAKRAGRLTLNPIKHIDLFGTIILPLITLLSSGFVFGWAKPVPVNPYNFKDQKWGSLMVAAAGPAVNFAIAIIFGLIVRFVNLPDTVFLAFATISLINIALGVFNLIPIPPLDGSHILFSFLSNKQNAFKIFMARYGLVVLVAFILFGSFLLSDIITFLFTLISGASMI